MLLNHLMDDGHFTWVTKFKKKTPCPSLIFSLTIHYDTYHNKMADCWVAKVTFILKEY